MSRHNVKSVRIRSIFGPYFPPFGLNTEIYSVKLRIQSECGKIKTRKTLNTDFSRSTIQNENPIGVRRNTEPYLRLCQTTMMQKSPVIDVPQGPKYAFGIPYQT